MKSWFAAAAVLMMTGVVAACSSTGDGGGDGGEGGTDPTSTNTTTATGMTTTTGTGMTTTTGTGMTTTTTTMPMDCGTITVSDPTCQDCLDMSCCTQLKACSDSDDCIALLNCQQGCADQACVDQCNLDNPAGVPLLDAVDACFAGPCAADCGSGGGICDSGLTIADPPTCNPCLSTACCNEFVACTGGTDADGNPLDDVKINECIQCLNAAPGMDPAGIDCAPADAAEACANASCAAECGG